MATYKKGYKKEKGDKILLKVFVSIFVSVFLIVGIAWVYHSLTAWKDYDHYTALTTYSDISNQTTADNGNYVVYLYDPNNVNCQEIKNKVFHYGRRIQSASDNFFIANTAQIATEAQNNNDTTSLPNFLASIDQSGTSVLVPSIVVYVDGQFQGFYKETDTILNTLDEINDGTFAPFN